MEKKILPIMSPDKDFTERWDEKRDMLNFPSPFRMILCGPPGCGKTRLIKNICLRIKPCFNEIKIYNKDIDNIEYDDCNAIVIDKLPPVCDWNKDTKIKKLLIIDDNILEEMDKKELVALKKLAGYGCTHLNYNIMIASQGFINIDHFFRKCANIFIIWRGTSDTDMAIIAPRIGYKSKDLLFLLKKYCLLKSDFLLIDLTQNTPHPLRKNGYEIIHFQE